MSIGDKMKEIEARAKKAAAETKEALKNDWTQTKADAEKAKNAAQAQVDSM